MLCRACGHEVSDNAQFCTRCGALLAVTTPSEDRWLGRTIAGRFTLVRLLGEGGIGRVYLAEQPMGNARRQLAVKMLLPHHSSKPEMVRRFLRECELLSVVEHPQVVRIYDFGEAEPSTFFIAMELVNGESLFTVIRREGALPLVRAMRLTNEIGRALAAAHDAGIVHRDLKPDNVMVVSMPNETETVKVLDFGIAKAIQELARAADLSTADAPGNVTAAGAIVGTPRYMSPEQFLGSPVDARMDVYALSLIAYEMLTGVSPFDAENVTGWASAHVGGEVRPFDATSSGATVPPAIRSILLRALAKRPEERPAMRAFLYALAQATVGASIARNLEGGVAASVLPGPSDPALAPTVDDLSPVVSAAIVQQASRGRRRLVVILAGILCAGSLASVATFLAVRGREGAEGRTPDGVPNAQCDRVARAKTCAEATEAMKGCPEAAGHAHEHAHVYRDLLCGE